MTVQLLVNKLFHIGGGKVPVRTGQVVRSMVFADGGIYAEDETILLRSIQPSDKEAYLNIYRAKEIWKSILANSELNAGEGLWNDFNSPSILNTVIIQKSDGAFCGFCGLQEYAELEAPELSIELVEEFQRRGYGTKALTLLMTRFTEVTGSKEFISKVSCGNAASQRLMRKLGGKPNGIAPFPGVSENILKMLEDDDTAHVPGAEVLAEEFMTTVRKLRSHVLVFKFS